MNAAQLPTTTKHLERHAWVDIAKGICIVAVVCLYAFNQLHELEIPPGWLGVWTAFARPFRMPDFFLISGLFLGRVLDRPWRSYIDTKVLHYFYFIALWSIFIYAWNWGGQVAEMGAARSLKLYIYTLYRPEAMLWFIQTLSLYFVITRLLRSVPSYAMLAIALVMRLSEYHTGIYPIDWLGEYYFFFLCGVFFAKYFFLMADWAIEHQKLAWFMVAAWAIVNQYMVSAGWTAVPVVLVTVGMAGISAVVFVSSLINNFNWAQPFRYLGQNSIVVYLGFYLPMRGMAAAYSHADLQWNPNLLGAVLVFGSIAAAVLTFKLTQGTALNFLFERPAWARLRPIKATGKSEAELATAETSRKVAG